MNGNKKSCAFSSRLAKDRVDFFFSFVVINNHFVIC